jgi:hypothetical protein
VLHPGVNFPKSRRPPADKQYMDVSSIALQGLQQAQVQLESAAQRVAGAGSATSDTADLSREAVSILSAKNDFAANINVMKVADDMQKSLINLLG